MSPMSLRTTAAASKPGVKEEKVIARAVSTG